MFYIFLQFNLTSLRGKEYFAKLNQKSGAGAGQSRVFLAPWSRSRSKKIAGAGATWEKNQELEPKLLEKKSGAVAGAGAAKKFTGSPALIFQILEIQGGQVHVGHPGSVER